MPDAKILIVDDEQSILDLVSAYLRQERYEVFTAVDGPAALTAARQSWSSKPVGTAMAWFVTMSLVPSISVFRR